MILKAFDGVFLLYFFVTNCFLIEHVIFKICKNKTLFVFKD